MMENQTSGLLNNQTATEAKCLSDCPMIPSDTGFPFSSRGLVLIVVIPCKWKTTTTFYLCFC